MINNIEIKNFRGFEKLTIEGCRRINVIVGDNGVGKTALLEAIFLALSGHPEVAVRLRQWRGLEGSFSGSPRQIEDALWGDYFHQVDSKRTISIALSGSGVEARTCVISRNPGEVLIPLSSQDPGGAARPVSFTWFDSTGQDRTITPKISPVGIQLPPGDEDLPDHFFFAAQQPVTSSDNAHRFSELSRARRVQPFIETIRKEYSWIEDLGIEVLGGMPVIHATVEGVQEKVPLTSVSGAINRVIGIVLAMASRARSVLLVDEVENGIYYKHQLAASRVFLSSAREYNSQLFLSTHSEEWLEAFIEAAGESLHDISLWRVVRSRKGPEVLQFSGATLKAGVEHGGEVR